MDLNKYLKRIKYSGDIVPTLKVLKQLQYHHLTNVPFENIDVQNKKEIKIENSYNKIIKSNRGGFCYELNSAFFLLLKEIGFDVKIISGRVFSKETGEPGAEFDHMAILAKIENKDYLVDVGFGDFTTYPLLLSLNVRQNDPCGVFVIERYNEEYLIVQKINAQNNYVPEYLFTEKECSLDEFAEMCKYHQISNHSPFTKRLICSLATEFGRITITGNTLRITNNGVVENKELKNKKEVIETLLRYFNINVELKNY